MNLVLTPKGTDNGAVKARKLYSMLLWSICLVLLNGFLLQISAGHEWLLPGGDFSVQRAGSFVAMVFCNILTKSHTVFVTNSVITLPLFQSCNL